MHVLATSEDVFRRGLQLKQAVDWDVPDTQIKRYPISYECVSAGR